MRTNINMFAINVKRFFSDIHDALLLPFGVHRLLAPTVWMLNFLL